MSNLNEYLTHSAGVLSMFGWIKSQTDVGTPPKIVSQILYMHPFTSKFFSIGIAKNKKKYPHPFLAIQPEEAFWFRLLQWDKVYIREKDLHFYLITKHIKGDEENYPDIPPFIIGISIDSLEKINLFDSVDFIEGREYRNDDNIIAINFNKTLFGLPIVKIKHNENFKELNAKFFTYSEVLTTKTANLQAHYGESEPDFIGDSSEATKKYKKYTDNLKNFKEH